MKSLSSFSTIINALSLLSLISITAKAQDAANGEKVYQAQCVTCHGTEGLGDKSQLAPKLAGQHDWYIVAQIEAIKTGKRSNANTAKMLPYVKNLSQSEIADLALFISTKLKH